MVTTNRDNTCIMYVRYISTSIFHASKFPFQIPDIRNFQCFLFVHIQINIVCIWRKPITITVILGPKGGSGCFKFWTIIHYHIFQVARIWAKHLNFEYRDHGAVVYLWNVKAAIGLYSNWYMFQVKKNLTVETTTYKYVTCNYMYFYVLYLSYSFSCVDLQKMLLFNSDALLSVIRSS